MKTILYLSLAATLWMLSTTLNYAQETDAKTVIIDQLEEKKEAVIEAEKQALKQEIEAINNRYENQEINTEEVETLKLAAAERHALNIENKLAILENQISLIKRNGEIDLNDKAGKIEIGIGDIDKDGSFLLGVKINDGKQRERKYDRRTSNELIFSFGLNNVITKGQSLSDSPFKVAGSRFAEIGFGWKTRVFKDNNWLRFKYGLSFQFNGLKPKDNKYLVDTGAQTELQVFPEDLKKSKFRLDNLVIPIHFEFGPSKKIEKEGYYRYSTHNQFKVGLGGYAGFNFGSRQKLRFKENGETVSQTLVGSYNTNNFVYGLSGYIGFDDISVYAKYDLNTIFKNNPVEQRNVSLGLRWDWD